MHENTALFCFWAITTLVPCAGDPESSLEIFFPNVMHCLADGSAQKWSNMSSIAWFNSTRASQCVSVYIILEIRIFKYWRSIQCTGIVLTFFYAIITTDSSAYPYVSNLIVIQGNNEKVHYWGKTNSSWPVFLIFLGNWIAFSVDNTRLYLGLLWTPMNNKNVSVNVLSARGK